ncbi:Poly(A) polymerase [Rhizopus microsporus]|uniref:Poly(A) polymerase n=1 Tax=Rhizopus microsporus TaxID=58291 RepID=A0A1X0SE31_RHIZD|nr:Poly(A) polymerase [Rhizopus microsporus]
MSESQENRVYPGITKPLSLEKPGPRDIQLTIELEKTLNLYGLYDSEERAQQRCRVLQSLDDLTKQFVKMVYEKKGYTELAKKAGGKVFTYGSYRLGVNATVMLELLKTHEHITDITAVTNAYVPLIKFKFNDIPIDFICARLNVDQIPEDIDLKDSNLLRNLDALSVRSLNGTRVADDILDLVPNVDTFRTVLRCIKLWATRKAIYSNVLGFLGGVAWAILVARICQLYPNASASTVIDKFFHILITWPWPSPVLLKAVEDGPIVPTIKPWNPKLNPVDRCHRMPIITPSYPSMCATHNVTPSTQRIIIGELKQAAEMVEKIIAGSATWSQLFQPHRFFEMYHQYLQITVIADDYNLQLKWAGLVEARIRQFVIKLEAVPPILLVHPFVDGFSENHICNNASDVSAMSLGRKPDNKNNDTLTIDICVPIEEFKNTLRLWPEYSSRHMAVHIEAIHQSDLPKDLLTKSNTAGKRTLKVNKHEQDNAY